MFRIIAALAATAPLAVAAQEVLADPAAPQPPPAASPSPSTPGEGFFVGAGAGLGFVYDGSGSSATVLTLRAGAVRSERLALVVDGAFADGADAQLTRVDVGVTVFPFRRFLLMRGAVGLTSLALEDSPTQRGPNALLGIGFELGRPRGASVTINVDGELHFVSSPGRDDERGGSSVSAWVGVDWY